MKVTDIKHWSAERISRRVLYILVGMTAVLFAAFRFVGYDMPYLENPDFNAPLLTGVLVWFMSLLVAVAFVVTVFSAVSGMRKNRDEARVVNGVPAARIAWATAAGTLVLMLVTLALGSAAPLTVNGAEYTDALWLRVADMFVNTSIVMTGLAVAAVAFGATRYIRKKEKDGADAHKA